MKFKIVRFQDLVNAGNYSSLVNYGTLNEPNNNDYQEQLKLLKSKPNGTKFLMQQKETNHTKVIITKINADYYSVQYGL